MTHDFVNIRKIFDKYKVISVPYYQRDFVWGKKNNGRNLYKFIDDIFTSYKEHPETNYFIGTLAFCSEKTNDVIDGQQRLTSIVLILSILSELKCTDDIKEKHKSLLEKTGKFVIDEPCYLTEELKSSLGLPNNFNSQGYKVDISNTVDKIKSQINNAWSGYSENWYDALYNYILDKVYCISLEYNSISDSLKYFLNINSLSIQLNQADIFFSILSQSMRICNCMQTIFNVKETVKSIGSLKGFDGVDIEGYRAYDDKSNKGIDNLIYVFLNAFYYNDSNIGELSDTGIGKWLSFYKNEVFNDQLKAKEFTDNFLQYLQDVNLMYNNFANRNTHLNPSSPINISWILLQYENYLDLLKFFIDLFRVRHNYSNKNIYEPCSKDINMEELEHISVRLNLTLINNYIRSGNKRLDGFITNIELSNNGYKKTIDDIVSDIDYNSIFNLNYNDHKNVSNAKIKDESRIIKVIFALQESFLNSIADNNNLSVYLSDILLSTGQFQIEHILTPEEYKNKDRLKNWIDKKQKFQTDNEFDIERFKLENLSLLDNSLNSSLSDKVISDKLAGYKQARKIQGNKWEYLILSLVDNSEYYLNQNIQKLNLPERRVKNIDQNTWEMSDNNRKFNMVLLEMAVKKIAGI